MTQTELFPVDRRKCRPSKDEAVREKIARLAARKPLRVLDLFSGCGGLSLGFLASGFDIVAACDNDAAASKTHGLNFHGGDDKHSHAVDITETTPEGLLKARGIDAPSESVVDVLVGGPPCQAFARVGRAKLREIDRHPEAFLHDPRAQLYKAYLDYVEMLKPLAILMENVPDVLNHGGQNIPQEICGVLEEKGYVCRYTLLNSVFFGVPQMRERMFLIGIRHELVRDTERDAPSFPSASNHHDLPWGYEGSRQVALRLIPTTEREDHEHFTTLQVSRDLPGPVTAEAAIGDLPCIDARLDLKAGRLKKGARRFDSPTMPYPNDWASSISPYVSELERVFSLFPAPTDQGLYDHQIRFLPRDYELFAIMRNGAEYPEIHEMATARFEQAADRARLTRGSVAWGALKASMVPPYDPRKFPNKWWKLVADKPVRTLMAHLGKDSYSHIHYDSSQARTISVREAARLQSFPDGFRFCGTMNPAFRQIGNAVPPLLSYRIASSLKSQLEKLAAQATSSGGGFMAAE